MPDSSTPALAEVRIPLSDGSALPAALAMPGAVETAPAVIVVHEALGLNADMRRIASRFADAGYVALAPDFLAGLGPMPLCIARFLRGIGRPGTGRPYRLLDTARAWLIARPDVATDRIGVAGFCMGGGLVLLWAAGAGTTAVRVAAPFYGQVPDDAERALAGVCPVVASYGGRDRAFAPMAGRLEAALTELGIEHDVKVYPDAGHSFMSRLDGPLGWLGRRLPMRAGYHEPSAEDAWSRVLDFFGRHLDAPAA